MIDHAKVQKLLNLTSSVNDSEALSALRMAQKYLQKNLGDLLATGDNGLSASGSAKDELYADLEALFEAEVDKVAALKKQNDDKEKTLRKNQRDIQNFKRDVKALEQKVEDLEEELSKVLPKESSTPAEQMLRDLEKLYDAEVARSDQLKKQMEQKDKSLKKAQRDGFAMERAEKAYEAKIEALEKMVNQLSEEVFAYKQDARR